MATLNITIDGRKVPAEEGQTVLQAAMAAGIKIPALCNHPALKPIGACRVCLVEVARQRTLQPACTFPVMDGMEVQTHSPKVDEARRFVLELLLSDHPLDCMTCERTGNCELQDLAYQYGLKESRFPGIQHAYEIDRSNPFYVRDYNKCILCRRCVRACDEINGVEAIGMIQRGFSTKIGTAFDGPMQDSPCEFCGMCVEVCPTAALVPVLRSGKGRPWEFERVATTCTYCGVGCQFYLEVKDRQDRAGGLQVGRPGQPWLDLRQGTLWLGLCPPPRPADQAAGAADQRVSPLEEVEWDEALDLVATRLKTIKDESGPAAFGAFTSAKCTNEENYVLQKFTRAVMGTNTIDHCARL